MKLNHLCAGLATLALSVTATLWAADAPSTAPATTSAPADSQAAASTAPAAYHTIASNDAAAISAAIGLTVTITGQVDKVSTSASGMTFINFEGNERGDFVAIIKKANLDPVNKAFNGDLAKAINSKKITVTGKLTKYRATPQLEVTKPEQLTITKE